MNGRMNIDDQIRDLASVVRHHDKRTKWLLLQMSDEELKRLGLDEPNRNADDWLDRVLRKVDSRLSTFLAAHDRLRGAKREKLKSSMGWLDRLKQSMLDIEKQRMRAAVAASKINGGMRK